MTPRYFYGDDYLFIMYNMRYFDSCDFKYYHGNHEVKEISRDDINQLKAKYVTGVNLEGNIMVEVTGDDTYVIYYPDYTSPMTAEGNQLNHYSISLSTSRVERMIRPSHPTIFMPIPMTHLTEGDYSVCYRDGDFQLGFETEAEYLQWKMSQ